jgi:hypothetical protein
MLVFGVRAAVGPMEAKFDAPPPSPLRSRRDRLWVFLQHSLEDRTSWCPSRVFALRTIRGQVRRQNSRPITGVCRFAIRRQCEAHSGIRIFQNGNAKRMIGSRFAGWTCRSRPRSLTLPWLLRVTSANASRYPPWQDVAAHTIGGLRTGRRSCRSELAVEAFVDISALVVGRSLRSAGIHPRYRQGLRTRADRGGPHGRVQADRTSLLRFDGQRWIS